jgi:hypothetical protein
MLIIIGRLLVSRWHVTGRVIVRRDETETHELNATASRAAV